MVAVEPPTVSCIQPIGVPGTLVEINLRVPPVLTLDGAVVVLEVGVATAEEVTAAVVVAAGLVAAAVVVAAVVVGLAVVVTAGCVVVAVSEPQPVITKTQTNRITRRIVNFFTLTSLYF